MNRLCVFARRAVPGEVKTRLSPSLPPGMAAELHRAMLADAVDAARAAGTGEVTLYWATEQGGSGAPDPDGVAVRFQRGSDLGERLATAFGELLEDADRAVVIGTDCPDLAPDVIRAAFAALSDANLVLGPARDGGYYLIGLDRPSPDLFRGIHWGTGTVRAETLERAEGLRLRSRALELLDDLDTPEDLVRFIARRSVTEVASGRSTESALRGMGLLPERSGVERQRTERA